MKKTNKDVDKNEWYDEYIGYLEKYNVVNGYNDGTFRGNNDITRAEVVTVVNRAKGRKQSERVVFLPVLRYTVFIDKSKFMEVFIQIANIREF